MDFSPLLILLFGGLIGWLFRHWRSADELAARRRDEQHEQLLVMSKDARGSVVNSGSGDHAAAQVVSHQSQDTTVNTSKGTTSASSSDAIAGGMTGGVINGVAFTVIEQELDELYQLSAQVKPLEYELGKAYEKLAQFKSIQEATCNDLDDTWVALQDEAEGQVDQENFAGFLSDTDYTVQLTSDEESPDEVGELYQLVAQVKPLQYELSRSRKSNNSLAADKERIERRLRSLLEQNNQQQEAHKLELAKGLATQLTQRDARIAELQARVETADRKHAELSKNSTDMAAVKTEQQVLENVKQQLTEENAVLKSELKSLQEQSTKRDAESSATVLQQKNELHSLQLQTDDQKIQLGNANKRLDEISLKLNNSLEVQSNLQQTIASKDEQIGKLSTQLDELSQMANTAQDNKNEALAQTEKFKALLSKAETRTAELQVQQTQAEQQWRYEMSTLQALTTGFEESKAKASAREAALEKSVSQGNSQRLELENRLKAATESIKALEQALESSESSSQSFAEYSKIAEAKVIQLSGTLSERESEIEKTSARAKAAEIQLQQRRANEQALTEKCSAAESEIEKLNQQILHNKTDKQQLLSDVTKAKQQVTELDIKLKRSEIQLVSKEALLEKHATKLAAYDVENDAVTKSLSAKVSSAKAKSADLNAALVLQRNNAKALEQQIKELERKLQQAISGTQTAAHNLAEQEQKRLADVHKISELQAQLKQAEASASKTSADSSELAQLEAQVLMLKNETSKYAAFQKDAQATALELLEAKERLKELDAQTQAAAKASDRLTSSNIENDRLQKELAKVKRDNERMDMAAVALADSKKRINELSKALSKAESVAEKAEKNDIELRRLRSELHALQAQRDNSVKSLDVAASDTTKPDAQLLKKLESDIVRRDKQIEQLMNRLSIAQQRDAQQTSRADSTTAKNKKSIDLSSQTNNKTRERSAKKAPVLFAVPKEKDDLKRIKGIGPVMEKTLNRLGITSFKQIAEFSKADVLRVSDALETFPGRIERDDWIGGANKQYKIKYKNKAEA